jgi:hypothetical protein
LLLQRLFFLQAGEPKQRIFLYLSAALIVDRAPSRIVPGVMVDGRGIEVKQRRWRRTQSLFTFSIKVLFRKKECLVVISSYFGSLSVIFNPQLE